MEKLGLELFTPFDKPTYSTTCEIIRFLHSNSKGASSKSKEDVRKSIEYAMKERPSLGGYITVIRNGSKMWGVSILNKTGLEGIMPDYILSHMAVEPTCTDKAHCEQLLMKKTLELCNGNVAFLVQANDPMVEACMEQGFEYRRLELVFSQAGGERVSESKQLPQRAN